MTGSPTDVQYLRTVTFAGFSVTCSGREPTLLARMISVARNALHDITVFRRRGRESGPRIQGCGQTAQSSLK